MGDRNEIIEDEENTFDDDEIEADEDDELADAGYFVEDEDGYEETKKILDNDDDEDYGVEPSRDGRGTAGGLLDEYPEESDEDEEEG